MNKTMKIDIGDLCTYCGKDNSFGSGLFVNRIPSGTDGKLILAGGEDVTLAITIEGYMCPTCQCVECDECGASVMDVNEDLLCENCAAKEEEIHG